MNLLQKKHFMGAAIFFAFLGFISMANSSGKTGVTRKNGSGCTCHGSAAAGVNVAISGPSSLSPGQTGNYTLTITGGPLSKAGTNIAASAGSLDAADASLKIQSGELTHTSPKSPTASAVTFGFKYTAPSTPGNVTLYATGNSVNGTGNTSGDQWNFAPDFAVSVLATDANDEQGAATSFSLGQNYPNPFNPSTQIGYSISSNEFVSLKVYNATGQEVATLVDGFQKAGAYSAAFSASNLTSGIYFYKLQAGSFSSVRKMIVTK